MNERGDDSRSTATPRRGSWSPAPPGFTGALAAADRLAPPAAGAGRGRPRAATPARGSTSLYPRYRVPLELTELDLDAARGHRRGDRRLPARRRGADGRRAARPRASWSSTSPPTSGCATCRPTSAGTASTARPSCSRSAVYGLTELYRERAARGGAGREPRLLPDRERSWRWRRWPSAGLLDRRRRSTPSRASPAPGGAAATRCTHVAMTENAFAYKTEGHRHRPEIEQELAALGSAGRRSTFVPHLLPLDQGELASCYVRSTRADRPRRRSQALYPSATRDEPFVELSTGRPACATSATRTVPRSTSPSRSGGGSWPSPRSTTSGRAPPARRSRTST